MLKRYYIYWILTIFIAAPVYGQHFVSGGISRDYDAFLFWQNFPDIFKTAYREPYMHTNYLLHYDYQKGKLMYSAELTYFQHAFNVHTRNTQTNYIGQLYNSKISIKEAKVTSGYLGYAFAISYVGLSEKKFNILNGLFLRVDIHAYEKESGHRDSTYSDWYHANYNSSTGQTEYEHTYTYYPVNYDRFNALVLPPNYVSFGYCLGFRYRCDKYFVQTDIKLSYYNKPRYENHETVRFEHNTRIYSTMDKFLTWNFGIKAGYQLPVTNKSGNTKTQPRRL